MGYVANCIVYGCLIIINIDSSLYEINTEKLIEYLLFEVDRNVAREEKISEKYTFNVAGIAKYEKSNISTVVYHRELGRLLQKYNDTKSTVVLLIDEFDSFEEPKKLAGLLKAIISKGVIVAIAGSSKAINKLFSGHISLFRSIIKINLGSLSRNEFKEIFYVANLLSEDLVVFDDNAIELIYLNSNGLPYFGQLFGYLSRRKAIGNDKSIEQFIDNRKRLGPLNIYPDFIEKVINDLPIECQQYEDCLKAFHNLPFGIEMINALSEIECLSYMELRRLTDDIINEDTIYEWRGRDDLVEEFISIDNDGISLSDPILKQYIRITKHERKNSYRDRDTHR